MDDLLRDRHMARPSLAWFVSINKQIVCDGLKTRQQAHEFVNTEIKPLMKKEESIQKIEVMDRFNTICCVVDDYMAHKTLELESINLIPTYLIMTGFSSQYKYSPSFLGREY